MHIGVSVLRAIDLNDPVHFRNVQPALRYVSGKQHLLQVRNVKNKNVNKNYGGDNDDDGNNNKRLKKYDGNWQIKLKRSYRRLFLAKVLVNSRTFRLFLLAIESEKRCAWSHATERFVDKANLKFFDGKGEKKNCI